MQSSIPFTMLLQLGWRNIWRHKIRNGMMFVAILTAVATIVLANALIRGWQLDMVEAAVGNLTGHVKILSPGYLADPSIENSFALGEDFQPGIDSKLLVGWTSRVVVPGVIISEHHTRGVQLVGIDPADEVSISFLGSAELQGEMLKGVTDRRVLIGRAMAEKLKTRVGRRVVLMSQGGDGRNREAGFRIAGIYDTEGSGQEKFTVFVGRSALQEFLGSTNVTEVSFRLVDDENIQVLRVLLEKQFEQLEISSWDELDPQAAAMFKFAGVGIIIWFAILMTALGFGLVNTLVTAVMERVKELGMLRAVGMRPGTVIIQVVIECLLIVGIGVALGLLLGAFFTYQLREGIDLSEWAQGIEAFHIQATLIPRLLMKDVLLVASQSLLFGLIASIYPAWRAVQVRPLEAMRR
ncbi:MAG: ABC-type lipoprotein release transport system permease subunit [Halieaceae bacterium]